MDCPFILRPYVKRYEKCFKEYITAILQNFERQYSALPKKKLPDIFAREK